MANADVNGDRYIIVGVDYKPDGRRSYLSIDKADFMDSATYHQLVRENIEPEIHFDYLRYDFEGHLIGVFRIYDCNDKPYMMRKDFGKLKQGNSFIRKGSHQPPLTRKDLDHIREKQKQEFTSNLKIGFDLAGMPKEIAYPAIGELQLPSDRAAEKIREILAERKKPLPPGDLSFTRDLIESGNFPNFSLGRALPYSQRSNEQLRENLENVKETYRQADLHALYEEHASHVNFSILNEGETYIEDVSINVRIPKVHGLRVAPKIYDEPASSGPFGLAPLSTSAMWLRHYPSVKNYKDYISVANSVGTLRHGIAAQAFEEPLRIVFGAELVGHKLSLECTLRGKQLRRPRKETLTIEVLKSKEET